MRTFSQTVPVENARQFLSHARTVLGGLPAERWRIDEIHSLLDRFTPPDGTYKAYPNEFHHLDEAMTDPEALGIAVSLVEHVAQGSVGTQRRLPIAEYSLLETITKCMEGLWLERERIPFELLTKAYLFLDSVAASRN